MCTRLICRGCTPRARTSTTRPRTRARRSCFTSRVCAKKDGRSVPVWFGAGSPFPRERASAGPLWRATDRRPSEARLGSRPPARQSRTSEAPGSGRLACCAAAPRTQARNAERHPQRRRSEPRRAARTALAWVSTRPVRVAKREHCQTDLAPVLRFSHLLNQSSPLLTERREGANSQHVPLGRVGRPISHRGLRVRYG